MREYKELINEEKVKGSPKFNPGLKYSEHLNNLVVAADTAYAQNDWILWHKILNCLFRNIFPYIPNKDEANTKYIEAASKMNEYNYYLRGADKTDKKQRDSNPTVHLHLFNMYLIIQMKENGLLIPMNKTMGDAVSA